MTALNEDNGDLGEAGIREGSVPCQVKDEIRYRRLSPFHEVHVCTTNTVAFLIQKTLVGPSTPFVKLTLFLYIVSLQYNLL